MVGRLIAGPEGLEYRGRNLNLDLLIDLVHGQPLAFDLNHLLCGARLGPQGHGVAPVPDRRSRDGEGGGAGGVQGGGDGGGERGVPLE